MVTANCITTVKNLTLRKVFLLSRFYGVTIDGVWIGNWIYCTLTNTTRNYTVIANSHTLQFTTARSKSSHFAVSAPVVAWWRIPKYPLLPCSRSYRLANVPQLTHCSNCRLSTNSSSQIVPLKTSRHEPYRKRRSSVSVPLLRSCLLLYSIVVVELFVC
jgi:hypothetical protein